MVGAWASVCLSSFFIYPSMFFAARAPPALARTSGKYCFGAQISLHKACFHMNLAQPSNKYCFGAQTLLDKAFLLWTWPSLPTSAVSVPRPFLTKLFFFVGFQSDSTKPCSTGILPSGWTTRFPTRVFKASHRIPFKEELNKVDVPTSRRGPNITNTYRQPQMYSYLQDGTHNVSGIKY